MRKRSLQRRKICGTYVFRCVPRTEPCRWRSSAACSIFSRSSASVGVMDLGGGGAPLAVRPPRSGGTSSASPQQELPIFASVVGNDLHLERAGNTHVTKTINSMRFQGTYHTWHDYASTWNDEVQCRFVLRRSGAVWRYTLQEGKTALPDLHRLPKHKCVIVKA